MGSKTDIGVVGLGVMGRNLALNLESKGYSVSVYNRTASRTNKFAGSLAEDINIRPCYSLEELVRPLTRPRKILMLVKAGKPVDDLIHKLTPFLRGGDILIDGGNSHFADTDRRIVKAENENVLYLGAGISGGEYGALHGPSIMPGGHEEAYHEVGEILENIAAHTDFGPCCTYLGRGSAGHYVKMVHNGIEYGVMEAIAEAYWFMNQLLGLDPPEMGETFAEWNENLDSYLMEITADILSRQDNKTDRPLIDVISDTAKQKGTGKWSVQSALDLGIAIPTITAGVEARLISALKEEREKMSKQFRFSPHQEHHFELNKLGQALHLVTVATYAQGMNLLQGASKTYEYALSLAEIAKIWTGGCIVRSNILKPIHSAYSEHPNLSNLFFYDEFKTVLKDLIQPLRTTVTRAKEARLPFPGFCSSLDYLDSITSPRLPANMIQAQRDYFGAHTYQRIDERGNFHTKWGDIHNVD